MPGFHEIDIETPVLESIREQYRTIETAFDAAADQEGRLAAIQSWDALRRLLDSWGSITHLRFNQDTTNDDYRKARDFCDELSPKFVELSVAFQRKLLESPHRSDLQSALGNQAFTLWESGVTTFDPIISDDLVKESKLQAEYVELHASAQIEFRGEKLNLSEIRKYFESKDRQTRHDAEAARWQWFADNAEALDRIYDDLVKLRAEMAKKLGFQDFVELGYRRMVRCDYGREHVERFRAQVRETVVPLCQEITRRQGETLGVDPLMYWDESIHDSSGNPAPSGDHDWLLDRAQEMFDALGGGLDDFFSTMRERKLLDLKSRHGKAGGGFCTSFPSERLPFIFANFNGTKGDVEVFTHEVGHAFQFWKSRDQKLYDYLWPTYESCEIHSMSLEFLTWPHMELFFGDDAARFRRVHLTQSLLFLPYGVAVDHFQHEVYENPEATPAERKAMWRRMEEMYLPWRRYGDMPHTPEGGMWQAQRHIYLHPFYYIDYTLALTCALQFWVRSERDRDDALDAYVKLCARGGEAAFQELARSADLIPPFDDGCLEQVVEQARAELGV